MALRFAHHSGIDDATSLGAEITLVTWSFKPKHDIAYTVLLADKIMTTQFSHYFVNPEKLPKIQKHDNEAAVKA